MASKLICGFFSLLPNVEMVGRFTLPSLLHLHKHGRVLFKYNRFHVFEVPVSTTTVGVISVTSLKLTRGSSVTTKEQEVNLLTCLRNRFERNDFGDQTSGDLYYRHTFWVLEESWSKQPLPTSDIY